MAFTEPEKVLLDKILAIEPEAHVSYYHGTVHPSGWQVHKWGYSLSKICASKIDALTEALKGLQSIKK